MTLPASSEQQPGRGDAPGLSDEAAFLSAIIDTQQDLAEVELDPLIVMRTAVERAQRLTGAEGASFKLIEGEFLVCRFGTGLMEGIDGARFSLTQSLGGIAMREGNTQYSMDCEKDARVDRALARKHGIRSLILAPLSRSGLTIGVLCVASRKPGAFKERHVSALTLMAGIVAAAFTHAAEFEIKKKLLAERTEALGLLRESEERFRSAFDHAAIGKALVSLEGRFTQVNRSFCQIVGYDEAEMLARDFQSITCADDLQADLALAGKLAAGEIPNYRMTKRYVHKEGHLVWVELSASVVRDKGGKALYFIAQVQDVSERKKVEEALRASEDEFRATFEMAGIGKCQTDLETGRLLRVNRKFCELVGYEAEELLGMSFMEITHLDDLEIGRESCAQMLRGEISDFTTEKRYVRKDGGVIWVLLSAAIIRESGGQPPRAVATLQDITERKLAECMERDRRRVLELVAQNLPLDEVLEQLNQTMERQIEGTLGAMITIQGGEVRVHGSSLPAGWREALQNRPLWLAAKVSESIWDARARGVTYVQSEEAWRELRPFAAEHCIAACWAATIQSTDGSALGLMMVFSREERRPTPAESQSLDTCTTLATICIDHDNMTRQLAHLVRHDSLTGLPNRLMFEDRLEQAMANSGRSMKPLAVLALDIDKFKKINDTMGHQAGDLLLQQFSSRIRGMLRQADTMARVGGDEFVIILPELTSKDGAKVVAQKLIDALAAPFDLGVQMIKASTSIGIAYFPEDGGEAVVLMKRADEALYRAKEAGRNGFSC